MVARDVCSLLLLASLLQCASAFLAPSPSTLHPLRRDAASANAFRCSQQPAGVRGLGASALPVESSTSSAAPTSSTAKKQGRTAPNAVSLALGFVAAASMVLLPGLPSGHPAGGSFGGPAFAEEAQAAAAAVAPDAEHQILGEVLRLVDDHFLDLNNKEGVKDSLTRHTYNGVKWADVRAQLDKKPLKDRGETYKQIKGALKKLGDRYTRFVDPEQFAKLTKYDITGVGLLLVERNGIIYVGAPPLVGSTGQEAGLLKDDKVVKIDGKSTEGLSPFEAIEALQAGPLGSQVLLEVSRAGGPSQPFSVERKISVEDPVSSSLVTTKTGRKVGYMKMKEFNAGSRRGIANAVMELEKDGAIDDLVLDLRGNPGGVLEGAFQVSGIFMEEGKDASRKTLVYVVDHNGEEEIVRLKTKSTQDTVTPLIILMDSKSASASEVLAGSLRDNCRALVAAPSNSYGKGVIQGAFPLSDGSGVIVTVAKYLTPKHTEINGVGVPYDIKLDLGRNPTKALQNGKLDFTAVDAKLAACVPPEDPSATPMPGSMKGGREGQSEDSKESLFSTRLR